MDTAASTFPEEEYAVRLSRLRNEMEKEGLDLCLFSGPETICYLAGLNHWGFFGLHVLVVPRTGKVYLTARQMEAVTMEHQLASRVEFRGYKDGTEPGEFTADLVRELGLAKARIGIDSRTLYRSFKDSRRMTESLPDAIWKDCDAMMNHLRYVKSSLEIAATRQAAVISERMTEAALAAIQPGVNEKAIAAEVFKEMALAGGEPPSFGPFLRPGTRLGEEHGTWRNNFLKPDDTMFVELSGSYQRYHAPMGRLVYLKKPKGVDRVKAICLDAFTAVTETMKPGATANEVYTAWQGVVDKAGLKDYQRHHCGYMVGLSFPPAWSEGGSDIVSLRRGSDLRLEAGMVFHVLSWLVGSRYGDDFISNTVLVTETGSEVLTTTSQNLVVT